MLSLLAEANILPSTVNPILAEQIYVMSELCVWYQRIFIYQFNKFFHS